MEDNPIMIKSFDLAVDIVELYKRLISEKKEFVLSKQILRSGTSIGANVKEAINTYSKLDFRYKMSIALKEANETEYWIELLLAAELVSEEEVGEIYIKVKEVCRRLYAIVKTTTNNIEIKDGISKQ